MTTLPDPQEPYVAMLRALTKGELDELRIALESRMNLLAGVWVSLQDADPKGLSSETDRRMEICAALLQEVNSARYHLSQPAQGAP